jgi:expansin (peptidoglycan-binding protein)
MGDVVVRIVDKCPGCAQGGLDLSETAFGMISPLSAGRIDITWQETECPVSGPIGYRFETGSTKDYAAIQLRNTRYPVASLASIDGSGAAHTITRTDDNYFVASDGLGPGPYALRVTDQRGHVLDDTGIALDPGSDSPGAAQFPVCP